MILLARGCPRLVVALANVLPTERAETATGDSPGTRRAAVKSCTTPRILSMLSVLHAKTGL